VAQPKYEELTKVVSDVDLCSQCGYCTFWCPIYQENPTDTAAARGKIALARRLLAGEQDLSQDLMHEMNMCLTCGTCFEHCPEKTPTPSIVVTARADEVRLHGVPFPYNIVYRWLIPRRRLFGHAVKWASRFQWVFARKTEGTVRHLAFFMSALGQGRRIPSIASKFFRELTPVVNNPPEGTATKLKVGYFSGCMVDFVFPTVGAHTVNLLTRNGVQVIVPREQGCCGAPVFLGTGDLQTARKLADTNVKAFEGCDYVVSNCATCLSAIKDYVTLLADTSERRQTYMEFASRVKHITEFLVDVLQLEPSAYRPSSLAKGRKVTWHDPCHLNRYLGVKEQPRQILNAIPDIDFREMVRPDWCCGMAGTFSMKNYELSKKIADRKIDAIVDSEADIIVTGCPGCQIQMMDNASRRKARVEIRDITELLE
jgi:glycolate oxidase iron-sulfur subunit